METVLSPSKSPRLQSTASSLSLSRRSPFYFLQFAVFLSNQAPERAPDWQYRRPTFKLISKAERSSSSLLPRLHTLALIHIPNPIGSGHSPWCFSQSFIASGHPMLNICSSLSVNLTIALEFEWGTFTIPSLSFHVSNVFHSTLHRRLWQNTEALCFLKVWSLLTYLVALSVLQKQPGPLLSPNWPICDSNSQWLGTVVTKETQETRRLLRMLLHVRYLIKEDIEREGDGRGEGRGGVKRRK